MNKSLFMDGTFEIINEIGSGSGGIVFLANHKRLKKKVALKKMKVDAQRVLDIRAEVDILKNLHHPYLPQVFDFVEIDNENGGQDIYTVMDFIPGKSFDDLLSEGKRFTPTQVAKYTRQICEAVEYLHSRNPSILHGDIKPANVMLTPEDNICLIDFNISGATDDLEVIAYTRGYASPEQYQAAQENHKRRKRVGDSATVLNNDLTVLDNDVTVLDSGLTVLDNGVTVLDVDVTVIDNETKFDGDGLGTDKGHANVRLRDGGITPVIKIDQRSDIFSIGATAYSLLMGQKPDPDYEKQVPVSQQNVQVSEGLVYIIDKAMELKPEERFQTVAEMLRAMDLLGKKDKRYKRLVIKEAVFCAVFIIAASFSTITAYSGYRMMRTDQAASHYEHAKKLYESREYVEDLRYILMEALVDESIYDNETLGNLYYLAAECNFEIDEYESALTFYERAISNNSKNVEYYCNYAISLSRLGRLDRAADVIENAVILGLTADKLSLMRGELAAASGEVEAAEAGFRECIEMTDDPYICARAYIMYSDLYVRIAGYEEQAFWIGENVEILKEAESSVSNLYLPVILERLVDAYSDMANVSGNEEYIREATVTCDRLIELGWGTFNNYMNLALLYEKLGEFESCRDIYDILIQKYGDNYSIYKNLAFVELEIQAGFDSDSREYGRFKEYYDRAVALYRESGQQQDLDTEMQLLEESYHAVINGSGLNVKGEIER